MVIEELTTCQSTNLEALARLRHLDAGSVLWTRHQTAGRGRDGRVWVQPPGSLAVSVVVQVGAARAGLMALAAGLALIHTVSDLAPLAADKLLLKWPNDVRAPGGKIAGILCEAASNVPDRLVVGLGVNVRVESQPLSNGVNQPDMAGLPEGADSLHRYDPQVPDLPAWLPELRDYLQQAAALVETGREGPLLEAIRQRDALLGIALQVQSRNETIIGQGAGIDSQGRLLVMTRGGVRWVDHGHVLADYDRLGQIQKS